jgi:Fic/DOC family
MMSRDLKKQIAVGGSVHMPQQFTSLNEAIKSRIIKAEQDLNCISHTNACIARRALHARALPEKVEPIVLRLQHPLSQHFINKHEQENRSVQKATESALAAWNRVATEEKALLNLHDRIREVLISLDSCLFVPTLIAIANSVTGQCAELRKKAVSLGADQAGVYWSFPSADSVRLLLGQLYTDIQSAREHSHIYAAIIGLVNLNCIHPFADGNGRASRILFNALLISGGLLPQIAYIPCKHIYALSNYGYEIRLRQVILKNDWLPIIDYFLNLLELFCVVARQGGPKVLVSTLNAETHMTKCV